MWLASTEGTAAIRSEPRAFVEAFRRRIDAGLLGSRPILRPKLQPIWAMALFWGFTWPWILIAFTGARFAD